MQGLEEGAQLNFGWAPFHQALEQRLDLLLEKSLENYRGGMILQQVNNGVQLLPPAQLLSQAWGQEKQELVQK